MEKRDYSCDQVLVDSIFKGSRVDAEGCRLARQNSGTIMVRGRVLQIQRLLGIWWGLDPEVQVTSNCGKRNCIVREHLRSMVRQKSYYKKRPPKWASMEHRFFDSFVKDNGCWLWTGPKTNNGYGMLICQKEKMMAHRWSFKHHYGMVPDLIRHTCDNPACVNPDHLLVGTHQLNAMDRETRERAYHHRVKRGEVPKKSRRCTSMVVCSFCGKETNKFNCAIRKNTSGLFYCDRACRTGWQRKVGRGNPSMKFTANGIASSSPDYSAPSRDHRGVFKNTR